MFSEEFFSNSLIKEIHQSMGSLNLCLMTVLVLVGKPEHLHLILMKHTVQLSHEF